MSHSGKPASAAVGCDAGRFDGKAVPACQGRSRVLLVALCLLPLSAQAFTGRVVAVVDGDTLDVEHDGDRQRVRVFGIDAPESGQPGGTAARRDLDGLVYGRTVIVEPPPGQAGFPVSYHRDVAVVTAPGHVDVGLTMLGWGDAWAYDYYRPPRAYDEAMARAARARLGLWAAPDPINPRDWRRAHPENFKREPF